LADLDEIWYADGISHANDDEHVKIETERKFQYGGGPFSETGSSNNSATDRDIL